MLETLKKYKTGIFKMGRCDVLVNIEDGLWHLIIRCNGFNPSYDEIKQARYKFIPEDVVMADLYPSKEILSKNTRPNERHLWEIYLKF